MHDWLSQIETYRRRASEMRGLAETVHKADAKKAFLKIADDYDALAQIAAREDEAEKHRRNEGISSQSE